MLMNTTFLGDSFSIKWQSREGKIHIELPGRQYMAVQMKKVRESVAKASALFS